MEGVELAQAPEESESAEKKKGLLGRVQQGVGVVKQVQADRPEKKVAAAPAGERGARDRGSSGRVLAALSRGGG
jgi:hypothetical protein